MRKLLHRVPYWYLLAIPTLAFYLGVGANLFVMGINHAQMPVLYPGGQCNPSLFNCDESLHVVMDAGTHLKVLGDWLMTPDGVASPGDFLQMFGDDLIFPCLYIWMVLMVRDNNRMRRVK